MSTTELKSPKKEKTNGSIPSEIKVTTFENTKLNKVPLT